MATNGRIYSGGELYRDAVNFWADWQEDPDCDTQINGSPREALTQHLVEHGAVQAEADWLATLGLDTVFDRHFRK